MNGKCSIINVLNGNRTKNILTRYTLSKLTRKSYKLFSILLLLNFSKNSYIYKYFITN